MTFSDMKASPHFLHISRRSVEFDDGCVTSRAGFSRREHIVYQCEEVVLSRAQGEITAVVREHVEVRGEGHLHVHLLRRVSANAVTVEALNSISCVGIIAGGSLVTDTSAPLEPISLLCLLTLRVDIAHWDVVAVALHACATLLTLQRRVFAHARISALESPRSAPGTLSTLPLRIPVAGVTFLGQGVVRVLYSRTASTAFVVVAPLILRSSTLLPAILTARAVVASQVKPARAPFLCFCKWLEEFF